MDFGSKQVIFLIGIYRVLAYHTVYLTGGSMIYASTFGIEKYFFCLSQYER